MKKYLFLIIITALFLSACSPKATEPTISDDDDIPSTSADIVFNQKEKACIDSGGTFSDSKCTCPDGTYEFDGKDVPLYNYEESTGLCIDPMGTPGGKMAEEVKALHSQKMKNTEPFSEPLNKTLDRVTKKPFGIKITKENSPVSPERFSGYHTGVDFEVLEDELGVDVSIYAICDGPLVLKKYSSGYGGVVVQQCNVESADVTVVYGHLRLDSISTEMKQSLNQGEQIGILGKGFSKETDNERKHLHLAIHKGVTVNLLGYVQDESLLDGWMNPVDLFK
jgi:murein DD-endopeptidase MepM/ murein hydrolase activator NlpD